MLDQSKKRQPVEETESAKQLKIIQRALKRKSNVKKQIQQTINRTIARSKSGRFG